jgi:ATP-dependent exoDNAse (exonuclease V) beta subunit
LFIESGAYLAYAYKDDTIFEQVLSNIEELISEAISFEMQHGYDLTKFVEMMERNIFFADHEKEEAFYNAENINSIELCTIHSTKGLEYPMIILADANKGLKGQASTEGIKFDKFEDKNGKHILVGFKIDDYRPLSYRLLNIITPLKHIEEKKRMLYVALTRAKNNIVISITISEESQVNANSYASMILNAIDIKVNNVSFKVGKYTFDILKEKDLADYQESIKTNKFEVVESLKPIRFESKTTYTPTETDETSISK